MPRTTNSKRMAYMVLQAKIGYRIRILRQSQYPVLSIHRLAVLAEVDPGQLSRAERGLAGLSLDALDRIAAGLNVSLGALVDPENKNPPGKGVEPDAVRAYDEYHWLVRGLSQLIWARLSEDKLARCSDTEQALIRHHIHAAIEEGTKRGHLLAEREIKAIRKMEKETGSETH